MTKQPSIEPELSFIGVTAICGEEGTGKTSMAMTFPKPIFHIELDIGGFQRVAWRLKDLRVYHCALGESISKLDWSKYDIVSKPYPKALSIAKLTGQQVTKNGSSITVRVPKAVEGMRELWQTVVMDFVHACQSPVATIILDSNTMGWIICHSSIIQEIQERQLASGIGPDSPQFRERLQPVEYGPANDRMRTVLQTARVYGKNIVLVHYSTDEYGKVPDGKGNLVDGKTGRLVMDGFKETVKLADLVVWTSIKETSVRGGGKLRQVVCKITKCGINGMGLDALGQEISASFDGIVSLRNLLKENE